MHWFFRKMCSNFVQVVFIRAISWSSISRYTSIYGCFDHLNGAMSDIVWGRAVAIIARYIFLHAHFLPFVDLSEALAPYLFIEQQGFCRYFLICARRFPTPVWYSHFLNCPQKLRTFRLNRTLSYSSWDGALAFKKIRVPIWRPEDQFGCIWWWSEFPIFPKNRKVDFPHVL